MGRDDVMVRVRVDGRAVRFDELPRCRARQTGKVVLPGVRVRYRLTLTVIVHASAR